MTGEETFGQRIRLWLSENSYLYEFTTDKIRSNYFLHKLAIRLGLVEKEPDEGSEPGEIVPVPDPFRIWQKTYDDEIRDAWRITEALIIELQKETASIGSKLIVFYIPPRAAVYKGAWQATKRKYGISDENWNVEQSAIELQAICRRNKIDYINPIAEMKAEANKLTKEGKQLYYNRDIHWNAEGHRAAGEILAQYINSNYLVKIK